MAKGIYKRGRIWWITYIGIDGKQYFESSKSSLRADAEYILACRRKDIGEGKEPVITRIPNYSLSQLSEKYLDFVKVQRSFDSKKIFIKLLVKEFGTILLKNFNLMMIEQYQSKRLFDGKKPATVNRVIATLKHMFTKAAEWEMITEDTYKKIKKVKFIPENNRRLRYLSREEWQSLINAAEPHLKPILITALNTGMRKGQILSLKWDNVDLKHGFILLDRTKNGERLELPINDTLKNTLQGITRRLDVSYVFYDQKNGRPFKDVKRSFSTALKRVETLKCSECSYQKTRIKSKDNAGNCPKCGIKLIVLKGIQDFHFHDLRHTFASHLIMAGVDITTIKELLGHKTLTMTLRYAHLAPSHKVKAVDILDRQISGGTLQLHDNSVNSAKKELTING